MNDNELEFSVSRLFDGDLSPAAFSALEAHLLACPSARHEYLEFVDLHNCLSLDLSPPAAVARSRIIDIQSILARQKIRTLKIAALSAAALIFLTAVSLRLLSAARDAPSVRFTSSPGTSYELRHKNRDVPENAAVLTKGSILEISRGTVEFDFPSGVRGIISGPAYLTLRENDLLSLREGIAWFHVPEGASGFRVDTPELSVVDLGTEFGILSMPHAPDEIHVIRGKVRAETLGKKSSMETLVAGQARQSGSAGSLEPVPLKPSTFLTKLPDYPPHLRWSFDEKDALQATGSLPGIAGIESGSEASPKFVPGMRGTALALDPDGHHVQTNFQGFKLSQPWTIAFWLKLPPGGDYSGYPAIVGWVNKSRPSGRWKIYVSEGIQSGEPRLSVSWGAVWMNSIAILPETEWVHVTVTSTGGLGAGGFPDATLYLNGERTPVNFLQHKEAENVTGLETDLTSATTANPVPMLIGSSPHHRPSDRSHFTGEIDELLVFNSTLSPEQIRKLRGK